MRIEINQEACSKCGLCVSYCPDAFYFDRKGKIAIRYWDIPVGLESDCKRVCSICPQEAVEVTYPQ